MAKGTGLIGNFKGKVGNTVGYKLSASNNGQTQGIRVYQPIVKNPKTAAQAEQRAKLLAVNATYRALKMVIDRGNEGLPYGNKSRLAWLKGALKSTQMPWIVKGMPVTAPVGCQLTKGTLQSLSYQLSSDIVTIDANGVTAATDVTTIGKVSTLLLAAYPNLKEGDQITIAGITLADKGMNSEVQSFVINSTSTVAQDFLTAADKGLKFELDDVGYGVVVIVSRQGDNGEHLRSSEFFNIMEDHIGIAPYDETSKAAAIESYRASAATNSDWAEESIQ